MTDTQPKPTGAVGSVGSAKNIYKSKEDEDGEWTWTEQYPKDVEEAAENAETLSYAVVVRNMKSNDSRKKLEAHSIVIQSPWLKEALGEILKYYPGVACELKRLIFEAPLAPFIHRWAAFTEYMRRDDIPAETKEHLAVLCDILKYEIGDNIEAFEDYVMNGVITFPHLWMIFQPGSVVVSSHRGPLSAFELEETEYMETRCGEFMRLTVDCVDYAGEFGRHREVIDIPEFVGTKKIAGLRAYPWEFHDDKDALNQHLTRRGQLWEKLAGHHYKSYEGTAITWDHEDNEIPIEVTGRIVIDIDSFNRFVPHRRHDLAEWKARDLERFADQGLELGGRTSLTPYHHLLARCRTRGYSLKLKKWLDFFIEQVGEIDWDTDAFEKLVLPEDHKELIMAFSESQIQGSSFDDVISGKGRGVICLLSGPPGVGKTLTAEAVAENLQVPLHTLSSGDLGTDSGELESGLSSILELVSRWNAILLLDECDVFLEARSSHDLERNKVVSVFLRTLEWYQGILFMTTNRVDNIDAAFQSRIHVSLEYPGLDQQGRRQIWKSFIEKASLGHELTDGDMDQLSRLDLNGRQIKNVLKTAQLLASRRKSCLKREFVDKVLAIDRQRPQL